MTKALPFTAETLAEAIKAAEANGLKVAAVRPDGTLILSKMTDEEAAASAIKAFVYFISDGEFVKIGYSADWRARLKALQTSNPRELCAAAVIAGTIADERALHRRFASDRLRADNEWFRFSDEIRTFIQTAKRVDL
jgi:hypothetical protein